VTIRPDVDFVRRVIAGGGGDLKKCFQCGTCSVVCALSPEEAPFPRQQMLQAQWGLKDRLAADPAIWWCHNCGDCTTRCPRGARPGDVFGALRAQAIAHYAWPGFLGRLAARPAGLPLLLVLPIAIFAAIAVVSGGAREPGGALEAAAMFPLPVLETLFFSLSGFVLLAFVVGLVRFVRGIAPSVPAGRIMSGLVPALTELA
jgi:quinone-modifying oxidoreductase subunit QmoC